MRNRRRKKHFGGLLLLFLLFQVLLPLHVQYVINVFHSKHNILVQSADLLIRKNKQHQMGEAYRGHHSFTLSSLSSLVWPWVAPRCVGPGVFYTATVCNFCSCAARFELWLPLIQQTPPARWCSECWCRREVTVTIRQKDIRTRVDDHFS